MSTPHPAPDTPEAAASPSGVEEDLAMLDLVAAKGLALAEAVKEDGTTDSAEAFDTLSRAVHLTVSLQGWLADVGHFGGPKARGKAPLFEGGETLERHLTPKNAI